MIEKTKAIILRTTKYGDSSLIIRALTSDFGIQSFISGGMRSKKGPFRSALSQALSQIEIVYQTSPRSKLGRIKESKASKIYQSILFDPIKNCLVLFLAEFLNKSLHEEEVQEGLFEFVSKALDFLDETESSIANFHLSFLLQMSYFLGFYPDLNFHPDDECFDLNDGGFRRTLPIHEHYIKKEELAIFFQLSQAKENFASTLKMSSKSRSYLLQSLLDFYRLHSVDFGSLKSLEVIQSVLR